MKICFYDNIYKAEKKCKFARERDFEVTEKCAAKQEL